MEADPGHQHWAAQAEDKVHLGRSGDQTQECDETQDCHVLQLQSASGKLNTFLCNSYVIFDTQGYLPPKDVVQLSLAYSTVFHIKLNIENLREAIQRCLRGKNTKVNIENFIKYILDVVL